MDLFGKKRKYMYRVLGMGAAFALTFFPCLHARAAESGWVRQQDGWYYYLEDGSAGRGWVKSNEKSYYVEEGGKLFTGGLTPDGYYVDSDGAWYQRTEKILGKDFTAPVRALSLSEDWPGKESLTGLKGVISQGFSGLRTLKITENAVEYVLLEPVEDENGTGSSTKTGTGTGTSSGTGSSTTGRTGTGGVITRDNIDAILSGRSTAGTSVSQTKMKETVLLGLYREPSSGRYRIDIRVALDGDEESALKSSSYDYGIFRAMVFQVSSAPEILTDGIYSAWEEDNRWQVSRQSWVQVGDCLVLYMSGDGYGRFYITPARKGN